MTDLQTRLAASTAAIRSIWTDTPQVGIVLGSGLADLADAVCDPVVIETKAIPHFAQSTAPGHVGRLVCGRIGQQSVVIQQGRAHAYEGYSFDEVAYPVRVMHALGVRTLILTNAAGAVNPAYRVGDIVLLADHINLMFGNPLTGPNDDSLGPRFPDMCDAYDVPLRKLAAEVARGVTDRVHSGVYVAMLGLNYETRAEYRMVQRLGGDVVGMSTVPENIVARHCGMRVLGLSIVSNMADDVANGHSVIANVSHAEPLVRQIVTGVLERLT